LGHRLALALDDSAAIAAVVILLASIGHGFIWVVLVNRLHAVVIPRWVCKWLTVVLFALAAGIPPIIAWELIGPETKWDSLAKMAQGHRGIGVYGAICLACGIWAIAQWAWRRLLKPAAGVERYCHVRTPVLLASNPQAGHAKEHILLARLPGNEILRLQEIDRGIGLPRLPQALDGISMMHLSDLHFTGRVGKSCFVELARRVNLRQPDLIVLTGDLLDYEAFTSWVGDTLGQLKAPAGVYFVLGNHERRVDARAFRDVLKRHGLVDLGGRWIETQVRGQRLILAGNEEPWFGPAADLREAPPPSSRGGPLRIALIHTPDQLAWARRNEVDLVLAGHTHGGQICLPWIGPIFSPTLCGVRYAYGTYYAPPTVMHVSKGVSADLPIRFLCPPEAVKLILHAATAARPPENGDASAYDEEKD
jgi:uncharacterized protein